VIPSPLAQAYNRENGKHVVIEILNEVKIKVAKHRMRKAKQIEIF
jgi:antitoxin component of MazEF toxin-antitoxin module